MCCVAHFFSFSCRPSNAMNNGKTHPIHTSLDRKALPVATACEKKASKKVKEATRPDLAFAPGKNGKSLTFFRVRACVRFLASQPSRNSNTHSNPRPPLDRTPSASLSIAKQGKKKETGRRRTPGCISAKIHAFRRTVRAQLRLQFLKNKSSTQTKASQIAENGAAAATAAVRPSVSIVCLARPESARHNEMAALHGTRF